MRLDTSEYAPRRGWWLRALAWAAASWGTALALTLAWSVFHALTEPKARGAAGLIFLYFGPYAGFYAGAALLPLVPALVGWALAGAYLDRAERRWGGVAAGTALLAVVGAAVVAPMLGEAAAPWAVWLLVWACLLLPRAACPALRPGAFGRYRATA